MTLKTFRAPTMAEALAMVKKELGRDAVILRTRSYKSGGWLGLGARQVIEITASSDANAPVLRPRQSGSVETEQGRPQPNARSSQRTAAARSPDPRSVHSASANSARTSGRPQPASPAFAGVGGPDRREPWSGETPAWQEPDERTAARAAEPRSQSERATTAPETADPLAAARPLRLDSFDESPLREPARVAQSRVQRYPKPRIGTIRGGEAPRSGTSSTGRRQRPPTGPGTGPGTEPRPASPAARVADASIADTSDANIPLAEALAPAGELSGGSLGRAAERLAVPVRGPEPSVRGQEALREELASIKRLVGHVLRQSASPAGSGIGRTDAASEAYLTLLDQGVSPAIADRLVGSLRSELAPGELDDPRALEQSLHRRIAEMIPTVASRAETLTGGYTIALLGPTGVGKTTTLAKLAAAYKLKYAKRVGLITCDTYRIAAVEQLRTYANIIGLPIHVASTPDDMRAARSALADQDLVLVDSPGRSQHDATRLDELSEFADAAAPDERHLVLSCAASEAVLERAAERFNLLGPDRLLFTKLDEAVQLGPILNLVCKLRLPIGFVTTGQEVPDHLERADADRIARMILPASRQPLAPSGATNGAAS